MVEGKELMCTVDTHLSGCNVIRSMAMEISEIM